MPVGNTFVYTSTLIRPDNYNPTQWLTGRKRSSYLLTNLLQCLLAD